MSTQVTGSNTDKLLFHFVVTKDKKDNLITTDLLRGKKKEIDSSDE